MYVRFRTLDVKLTFFPQPRSEAPVPIKRLFVANRGEIALRIIATAKKMGIHTVVGWSDPDKNSAFVALADESARLGPAPSSQSYLNAARIIQLAHEKGCDALHPGYGFLSEDADFAASVIAAGITFVGPSPSSMRRMGQKDLAKQTMHEAGVSVVPGYHGSEQDARLFQNAAQDVGFPVMVKACLGGGGKGIRIVETAAELPFALESASKEALRSFRDGSCLMEKVVVDARHVEVQVFGDTHGNVVHLGDRDCSVQRSRQKLLEEAPAHTIRREVRQRLRDMAVQAGKAVKYAGAGTVEFLYCPADEKFYFLEMNTRLQVEHTVTEEITGLDLVEWQLRVAGGERLPLSQAEIDARLDENRFSLEARICAEECLKDGFVPSVGKLNTFVFPPETFARIDSGVRPKDEIYPFYDSMIAKVIVRSNVSRLDAIQKLDHMLKNASVSGISTNIALLRTVLNHKSFQECQMTTVSLEQVLPEMIARTFHNETAARNFAAVCTWERAQVLLDAHHVYGTQASSGGLCHVLLGDAHVTVSVAQNGTHFSVASDKLVFVSVESDAKATIGGIEFETRFSWDHYRGHIDVWLDGVHFSYPVKFQSHVALMQLDEEEGKKQ